MGKINFYITVGLDRRVCVFKGILEGRTHKRMEAFDASIYGTLLCSCVQNTSPADEIYDNIYFLTWNTFLDGIELKNNSVTSGIGTSPVKMIPALNHQPVALMQQVIGQLQLKPSPNTVSGVRSN